MQLETWGPRGGLSILTQEHSKHARDSEWFAVRRCLALLGQLFRGPASKRELIQVVRDATGADTYAPNRETGRISSFEQDINRRLSERFEAVVRYNRHSGLYELVEFAELPGFNLPDEALAALAFLDDTFGPDTPRHEEIKVLRNHLLACLPQQRRTALANQRVAPTVDLRRLYSGVISPIVEEKVEQAVLKRRLLRFFYRSPAYEDGVPRHHTVEPYEVTFDTRQRAPVPLCILPADGWPRSEALHLYRFDRILPEGIELLETKLAPGRPALRATSWSTDCRRRWPDWARSLSTSRRCK